MLLVDSTTRKMSKRKNSLVWVSKDLVDDFNAVAA